MEIRRVEHRPTEKFRQQGVQVIQGLVVTGPSYV
jgi:hypothetical protein